MKNKKGKSSFPIFWSIALVVAFVWFLRELGYLNIDIPWLPLILVIICMGGIVNHFNKK